MDGASILLQDVAAVLEGPVQGVRDESVVYYVAVSGRIERLWKPNEGAKAVPGDGSPHIHSTPTAAQDLGHVPRLVSGEKKEKKYWKAIVVKRNLAENMWALTVKVWWPMKSFEMHAINCF